MKRCREEEMERRGKRDRGREKRENPKYRREKEGKNGLNAKKGERDSMGERG